MQRGDGHCDDVVHGGPDVVVTAPGAHRLGGVNRHWDLRLTEVVLAEVVWGERR